MTYKAVVACGIVLAQVLFQVIRGYVALGVCLNLAIQQVNIALLFLFVFRAKQSERLCIRRCSRRVR